MEEETVQSHRSQIPLSLIPRHDRYRSALGTTAALLFFASQTVQDCRIIDIVAIRPEPFNQCVEIQDPRMRAIGCLAMGYYFVGVPPQIGQRFNCYRAMLCTLAPVFIPVVVQK
ncbi:hypothetical protein [Roseibium polysiphoniae]|uniref:hypothetical protein n=1 Tax=Roseibium polysiphoniae TaxID=2571221 RepID=UPI003296C0EA